MTPLRNVSAALGFAQSLVVYYGQPWRRLALKRFYRSLLAPGSLAFDIGAHVGSRSRTLLDLGFRVVAIEPQPMFADFIEKRLSKRLAGFERVAVGSKKGSVDLMISSRHPTVTSVSQGFVDTVRHNSGFSHVVWDRTITVPMLRLDDLIDTYGTPDFCKIDVEGAEAEVLAGLSKPVALVAFEYVPAIPAVAAASIAKLSSLGDYRFNRVEGERHRFVSSGWKTANEIISELDGLAAEAPAGDVYAKLVATGAATN